MNPGIFSRDNIRALDRQAVEQYAMPSIVLMENAARSIADHMDQRGWLDIEYQPVLIVVGPGNNGGDGLALARHLHNRGISLQIILTRAIEKFSGDARTNLDIVQAMNLPMNLVEHPDDLELSETGCVVDALLGTGLTREVRSPASDWIAWMNDQPAPVLSVDLPSGMDADTGQPLGVCVRAALTVSFVGLKKGFTCDAARNHLGDVAVGDIGVPVELIRNFAEPQ